MRRGRSRLCFKAMFLLRGNLWNRKRRCFLRRRSSGAALGDNGKNAASVQRCCAQGTVTGGTWSGGLIGTLPILWLKLLHYCYGKERRIWRRFSRYRRRRLHQRQNFQFLHIRTSLRLFPLWRRFYRQSEGKPGEAFRLLLFGAQSRSASRAKRRCLREAF